MADRKPKPIESLTDRWFMAQYQKRQRAKRAAVAAWLPTDLFQNGEVGFWYDPSDLTTLYQDSAGTTPVTGVEQPVGLMLDKSVNGFNAAQSTAAARPVLSARYNLLEQTEAFDSAYWTRQNTTITTNAATDPLGGSKAGLYEAQATASLISVDDPGMVTGKQYTLSLYAKEGNWNIFRLGHVSSGAKGCWFDLSTGTILTDNAGTGGIEDVGNGWFRCSITVTASSTKTLNYFIGLSNADASTNSDAGDNIYIWGASVAESQYSSLGYQRVGDASTTASDYDSSASFPKYLRFDGVDDCMAVNGLTAATGPITAHFGYVSDDGESVADQKLLDIETGRAAMAGVANTAGAIGYFDTAWTEVDIDTESLTVATFNLNASTAEIRANGTAVDSGATWTESAIGGTVSLGCTYTLAGGRLDGNIYSAILRNTTSTADEIGEAESYINGKMGGGLL